MSYIEELHEVELSNNIDDVRSILRAKEEVGTRFENR